MSIRPASISDALKRASHHDWSKADATTEEDIARHAAEDDSATDHVDLEAMLKDGRAKAIRVVDVAAIRAKTGLSQDRFARKFGISPHTLRNWEQRKRRPDGPALALLKVIDREPEAAMRALSDGD
ncbi:MAG TPA: helix-turn-helix domain-containing protein [Alphaproteobacteria bacterium]|nr:helix-turn-helix domain-containing protein [Alphaproteobacteria bacterium]